MWPFAVLAAVYFIGSRKMGFEYKKQTDPSKGTDSIYFRFLWEEKKTYKKSEQS